MVVFVVFNAPPPSSSPKSDGQQDAQRGDGGAGSRTGAHGRHWQLPWAPAAAGAAAGELREGGQAGSDTGGIPRQPCSSPCPPG